MKRLFLAITLLTQCALSEMHAQTDVTSPGDLITGGQMSGGVFVPATQGMPVGNANMFPANGKPAFAIDNDVSRSYRNFGVVFTGFVVTPAFNHTLGGTFVTRLDFATGSDAPERDPLTFTLEGTNGDPLTGTYTLIASGSTGFDTDPGRSTYTSSTFPAVGAFTSYRLIFPTVRNSATADSMQVGDVGLVGQAVPEPSIVSLLGLSAIGLMGARRKRPVTV